MSKSYVTPKSRREQPKPQPITGSGARAVEWRCCCPQEQSQESCTWLYPEHPSCICVLLFPSKSHSPESYKGSWLLQNITANILTPSPNITEILCPYVTVLVLYIFFYLASAHWIFFFFFWSLSHYSHPDTEFFSLLSGTMRIFLLLFQMFFTSLIQKGIIPHYIFGLIIRWWWTIDW